MECGSFVLSPVLVYLIGKVVFELQFARESFCSSILTSKTRERTSNLVEHRCEHFAMAREGCCCAEHLLKDFRKKSSWRLSSEGRLEPGPHGLSATYRTPI
ncbi:unnamed protein product [Calypogeia fissa]